MAESERRQRVISSAPRLSPDDVANRVFAKAVRGVSETEVRSFLRRVSEELAAARAREEELLAAVDDLEERLRAPRPLDEQELLDALGEETARLLRSAREAGEDIRARAEEKAARVLDDAQEHGRRVRAEADELLQRRREESEARAAETVAAAEAHAQELRDSAERYAEEQHLRAETEADGIVEQARTQGRDMLEEAKLARERVLNDLGRRRALLQAQLEELRNGRDALIDAYRVVKRTFLEATEALAQVEARAAAGRLAPEPEIVAGEVEAGLAPSETAEGGEAVESEGEHAPADVGGEEPAAAGVEGAVPPADGGEAAAAMADVDSLFARIRAGQAEAEVAEAAARAESGTEAEAAGERASEAAGAGEEVEEGAGAEVEAAAAEAPAEPATAADRWRARRREDLSGLAGSLVKQAKRQAQDDQNSLLDAVRRFRGRPESQQVVPAEAEQVGAWSGVLRPAIDPAYASGSRAAGGSASAAPDDLLRELAGAVVGPLRERLAAAIDTVEDHAGLAERIGARYREWKNQALEPALRDALATAWTRGVFDTVPDGAVMQWIPEQEGRCADCDDNALEPTAKGEAFPTGQLLPPAHPGCRCLLVPADA
jgi:DivIVA domain-containing protein